MDRVDDVERVDSCSVDVDSRGWCRVRVLIVDEIEDGRGLGSGGGTLRADGVVTSCHTKNARMRSRYEEWD
jgi:hypothetical protein